MAYRARVPVDLRLLDPAARLFDGRRNEGLSVRTIGTLINEKTIEVEGPAGTRCAVWESA